ncbi:hypothetical protein [Tessaracoccus sp. OH4464_COT-324]|uniref:hypothetical protein n=1 Tax=Tessaracoccus sp. OH4464_COT-324 TaxID=2491059 RepID=UPI000F6318A5|nr:hypothetical protein [Tessaracoccus sp. OH4464_COT-324]RRD45674.1 hypothetical protein EII42_10480 [Tessaracoccus sp. OH4464_COT-324]
MSIILSMANVTLPSSAESLAGSAYSFSSAASYLAESADRANETGVFLASRNEGPALESFLSYFNGGEGSPRSLAIFSSELAATSSAMNEASGIVAETRNGMLRVAMSAEAALYKIMAAPAGFSPLVKQLLIANLVKKARHDMLVIDFFGGFRVSDALSKVHFAFPADAGLEGEEGPDGYKFGPPKKPEIQWDEDFEWDSEEPTASDHLEWHKWGTKVLGARLLRPDLARACEFYEHFRGNTGEDKIFDYEAGAREDEAIKKNIESEIARTAQAADKMAARGGGSFQITGPSHEAPNYPKTEGWQKTIGGYQQWSSADVEVKDGMVTMTITVHAEDRYNFNRGQKDIASDAPDSANGRFQEIGWAKSFNSHGEVKRVITWPVGSPPPSYDFAPEPRSGSGR